MSDDPLATFQEEFKKYKAQLEVNAVSVQARVREAKAMLDSVSGEETKHIAQMAFANAIDAAMKGEALVSKASPAKFRLYTYGAGAAAVAGVAAFAHWGLKLF